MPKIPVYESRLPLVVEQGPRIPVREAGMAWQGVAQLGQQAQNIVLDADERVRQLDNVRQLSELSVDAQEKLANLTMDITSSEDFNLDPQGQVTRYQDESKKLFDSYQQQITDDKVKTHFSDYYQRLAVRHGIELKGEARKKQIDIGRASLEGVLDKSINYGIASDPDEAQRTIQTTIAGHVAAGSISHEAGGELLRKSLRRMETGIVSQDIHADPEGALTRLNGNGYPLLDDEILREQLIERAERQIQINQSRAERVNSMGRHTLQGEIKDSIVSARATGQPIPGMTEKIIALWGPEKGPLLAKEYQEELGRSLKFHDVGQEIAYLPPEQAWQKVEALRPEPGTPGYEDNLRTYADLSEHLQKRDKMLFDPDTGDPAAYAMGAPEVRNAPEDQQIERMVSLQKTMGVPEHLVSVLTKKQAADWVAKFNKTPPAAPGDKSGKSLAQQRIDMLAGLKQQTGKYYDMVFRDLVRAKLNPENQILNYLQDDPNSIQVLPVVAEAINQGKELRANLGDKVVKNVENSVLSEMADWRATVMHGDYTGGRVEWANRIQNTVRDVALVYAQNGMSESAAAQRAAQEVINHLYHPIKDTYRVPAEFDLKRVNAYAELMKARLGESAVMPPEDGGRRTEDGGETPPAWAAFDVMYHGASNPNLKPEQLREDYLRALKRAGKWVTNEDETGLYLVDELGLPVLDSGKQRYEFRFEDAQNYRPPAPGEPGGSSEITPFVTGSAPRSGSFSLARLVEMFGPAKAEAAMIPKGKAVVEGFDIGPYATSAGHESRVAKYAAEISGLNDAAAIERHIKSVSPESPLTGTMVTSAADRHGVPPAMVLAIMREDSTYGTRGKAVRTRNPGNVGNDDEGNTRTFASWQEGVEAVARWLDKHRVTGKA